MSRVPRIRFKGFEEDWEQRKLGECFTERTESMPKGELISVTINGGIKRFSELGRHDNSNEDKSKYKKVCIGDIAYNSMRMWQGASGYSPYNGIVSPAYTVLLANDGVNSKCIAFQFKLPRMIHVFQINSQGITSDNWNLKFPTLSDISIYISRSIDEQGKIASLLESLDHLITLHQRKLEKLKIIKKSMLENLFPQNGEKTPKIRFSGFTEDWEQCKLGEVFNFYYGVGNNNPSNGGQYPVFGAGGIQGGYTKYNAENSIIIGHMGDAGCVSWGEGKHFVTYNGTITKPKDDVFSAKFGYYLLLNMNLRKYRGGSGLPFLTYDMLTEMETKRPNSRFETQKIANYFSYLDHLITLHQSKVEKLQKIKKSMLESMFV